MLQYARIEDAIIERIRTASESGALGYRLAEVESYGGQLDDENFFTQLRRFPAVWVTVAGGKPKRISARRYEIHPAVAVMVGSRNVRGERQTRHGTVTEVGSYQMLDDVCALLTGKNLGLAIEPLARGVDRTIYNTRLGKEARSVLSVEFATHFVFSETDEEAGDLLRVGLHYNVKPGDDDPDASDLIELRAPA